tara:strand:+ start:557 stop:4705 length:4149 start_codon:yes stop_codon:yes gene_type:complete
MKKFAVISFIVLVAGILSLAALNAENGKKAINSGRIENAHITQKQLKNKIDFKMKLDLRNKKNLFNDNTVKNMGEKKVDKQSMQETVELLKLKKEMKEKADAFINENQHLIEAKKKQDIRRKYETRKRKDETIKTPENDLQFIQNLVKEIKRSTSNFSEADKFYNTNSSLGISITINDSSHATIDPGDEFHVTVNFSEEDSEATLNLWVDADANGVLSDDDFPLWLGIGEDGIDPEIGEIVLSDNGEDDENSEEGVFEITVDDWNMFMGFSVIFQVTDDSGSAEAALTINPSAGSEMFSGTVSPITASAMVLFGEAEGEPEWFTFTDSTGYFEIYYDDILDRQFFATDINLSLETEQFMFKIGGENDETPPLPDYFDIDISRDGFLEGAILNSENDEGIEDALVAAFGFDLGSTPYQIGVVGMTISDSSGSYQLPLQAIPVIYMDIDIEHPDYYVENCDGFLEGSISEGDVVETDCWMTLYAGFVEGHVYSAETGEPLENIEMWIGDFTENDYITETDENGFYQSGVEESGLYAVCASDWETGYYQSSCMDSIFIPEDGTVVVNFYLDGPDGSISGTVTDAETGEPIGGIIVSAYNENWNWYETETDNNGSYALYVENGSYFICSGSPFYQESCENDVVVQDSDVTVDFSLEGPEGIIEGFVTDAETGNSLEGILVFADDGEWNIYDTVSDQYGYFKLGVNNATYSVVFIDINEIYEDTSLTDIVIADNTVDASMAMTPIEFDGAVQGTVMDEESNPIFALVFIVNFTTGEEYMMFTDFVTGEYYQPLQNGYYLLLAQDLLGMFLPAFELIEIYNDTVTLDFILQPFEINAILTGTVEDTAGNPLIDIYLNASVVIDTVLGFTLELEGFSEEDGSFEIGVMGFDNSPYKLCGEGGDYIWYEGCEEDILISEGDTVEVTLVLEPEGGGGESAIKGYVYDPYGNPVAYSAFLFAMNYTTGDSFSTQTDAVGFFYMDVTNGYYEVCAYDTESGMSVCDEVYVWDEVVYLELYLEDGEYPEGVTLDNGEIAVTIYENGLFGSCGGTGESGIEWNGTEYLCDGGIAVGVVIDSTYGYLTNPDWFNVGDSISVDTSNSELIAHSSYWFSDPWGDFYINIDQTVTLGNLSGYTTQYQISYQAINIPIPSIYLISYMDFDIGDDYEDDGAGSVGNINEPGLVSYMYDMDGDGGEATGYIGIEMFDQISHHHISSFPFEDFWEFLSEDIQEEDTQEPQDYIAIQTTGPFDLDIGESITLTVGAGVGDGLDGMVSVLDALHELSVESGEGAVIPESFALYQNYPNPFNPVTTIRFNVPVETTGSVVLGRRSTETSLQIYDIKGRLVDTLVSGELAPGTHSVEWDASDMVTGVYIYRFTAGGFVESKKLILLK